MMQAAVFESVVFDPFSGFRMAKELLPIGITVCLIQFLRRLAFSLVLA